MAPKRSVTSRSASPLRLVKVETWQPAGRITRTLTTRRIPFTGDPAVFIARAAALVPRKRPWRLVLGAFDTRKRTKLCLEYGTNARGVRTDIWISLEPADIPAMLTYVLRTGREIAGLLFCVLGTEDGDALSVPSVTRDELAQMPTLSLVL
jgi:hypothetical protein